MNTEQGRACLERTKVMVIVRGVEPERMLPLAEALREGGIRVLEVTLNTAGALDSIRALSAAFEDRMWIGAGTVLDVADARRAIEAGARFLVTPNAEEDVIRLGTERGIPVYPGALTPTEIVRAWKAGAEAVKIFPSASLGLAYLKELQGPLSHIPMIAVGGVNAGNIGAYLEIGCRAVGIGGSLVKPDAIREGRYDRIRDEARRLLNEVDRHVLSESPSHGGKEA